MKIAVPVKCQNGHSAIWIIEISGLDVRTIGVDEREQPKCDCPKHEIGQGYFPAGKPFVWSV